MVLGNCIRNALSPYHLKQVSADTSISRCTSFSFRPGLLHKGRTISSRVDHNISTVKDVYSAALRSVQPVQMVKENIHYSSNGILKIGKGSVQHSVNVNGKNCHIVAFGKAVIGMVTAVDSILEDKITSGIASVPTNIQKELKANGKSDLIPRAESSVKLYEGAHLNIPDESSLKTSQRIQEMVCSLTENDVLITLTSGGGSNLLCLPVPPLTLKDLSGATKSLANAGAGIVELNTVRKHIDILKGGGLAQLAYPAQVINLVLSDVVGDPLDTIASGPTVPDLSTAQDALRIVEKYLPRNEDLPDVKLVLQKDGKQQALSSMGLSRIDYSHVHNIIIGSNRISLAAAVSQCDSMSVIPVLLTSQLCGNATQVGRDMVELAKRILNTGEDLDYVEGLFEGTVAFEEDINNKIKQAKDLAIEQNSQVCLLFGGETTVEVTGTGRGGRNQEMCLSAMVAMDSMNLSPNSVTFASIGTDGQDGPTSAAGAVVAPLCSSTSQLDPLAFLKNNDSHSYFSELEGGKFIYNTGLTGTNVMDIGIMLLDFEDS